MKPSVRIAAVAIVAPVVAIVAVPVGIGIAQAAGSSSSATYTRHLTRVHVENGKDVVVDNRTITVSVGSTSGLQDRRGVRVSWSGAKPTVFTRTDPNTELASTQEFPVVILQCRGVDSTSVPLAQRLRPETCWTQTPGERFLTSPGNDYPAWRLDRYSAVSQRARIVGAPKPIPSACAPFEGYAEHWLHFVGTDGHDYPGGQSGCAGMAAESAAIDSKQAMPPNTTYASTAPDGTGSARFIVWTTQTNASLGCTGTVACSMVIIPIEGVSCDVGSAGISDPDALKTATDECQAPGGGSTPALTNTGRLWWSASNWRNRITVPLHFRPLPVDCGLSSKTAALAYGSELLIQATQSWSSKFCDTASLFPFRHIQVGEPQARNLLQTGSITAAFTTDPPATLATPHVMAPTALSGFGIAYAVDDAAGHEYRKLRLTPRLLAKLLTQSYPAIDVVKTQDPDLAGNPTNISVDPEFQALNPGVKHGVDSAESAAMLYALSSDSDVIHALTAYINADPEARSWLNGKPDPWGMTVNSAYKGIALPLSNWPLLDTWEPADKYAHENNDCLYRNPVPLLPLVAAPALRLAQIAQSMQFSIAPSTLICDTPNGDVTLEKLIALGRQTLGSRFLLGVVSLGDAARYDLDIASLQTRVTGAAPAKLTDATGRSFASATPAGLAAGAKLLRADSGSGSWQLDYSKLVGSNASADAYPGTMLVSTLVPTSGLDRPTAARYATFLRYAAGPGQVPGLNPGELPPGYLPVNASSGLGALAAFTLRAADAVQAQGAASPSLVATPQARPTATPAVVPPPPGVAPPTLPSAPGSVTSSAPQPTVLPVPAAVAAATAATNAPLGGPLTEVIPVALMVAAIAGFAFVVLSVPVGRRRP